MNRDTYLGTVAKDRSSAHQRSEKLAVMAIWAIGIGGLLREFLGQSEITSFGFYNFHTVDVGVALAFLACLASLFKERMKIDLLKISVLVVSTIILLNFTRGLILNPSAALLWSRTNIGICAILLLSISIYPSFYVISNARKTLLTIAYIMALLAVLRLFTRPSLFMIVRDSDFLINDGGRPLTAQGAFCIVLASGLLVSDFFLSSSAKFRSAFAAMFLATVVILTRQGTASIAVSAVIITILVAQRSQGQTIRLSVGALLLMPVTYVLYIFSDDFLASSDAIQRAENLSTRKEVWSALLSEWPRQPLINQLLGLPGGEGLPLQVYLSGHFQQWDHGMHSMYYGMLPIAGYIGAVFYIVILLCITMGSIRRLIESKSVMPAFPLAFCLATIILSYSYELRADSLLGFYSAMLCYRYYSNAKTIRAMPEARSTFNLFEQ